MYRLLGVGELCDILSPLRIAQLAKAVARRAAVGASVAELVLNGLVMALLRSWPL